MTALIVGAAVVANMPPLWTGQLVADNLERHEDIPSYWLEATDYLDATDGGTRVLEVPGTDFASLPLGQHRRPRDPGPDRAGVRRTASSSTTARHSRRTSNSPSTSAPGGHLDPEAIAPLARLLGAGQILLRNDLQYERYRMARPRYMWDLLRRATGTVRAGDVRIERTRITPDPSCR